MFKLIAVVANSVLLIASVNARAFTGQQFIEDAKVHITQRGGPGNLDSRLGGIAGF